MRLIKFLDIENTLSSFQIGFRRGYRTSDHVSVLNTIINSYFSKGKKVYACFVDFSKAYDSVWRKGLLYKLILNGLSFQFISLIDSMYSELKATVKLSNGITPFFNSADRDATSVHFYLTFLLMISLTFFIISNAVQETE